jgi:hypothetical protein
MGIEMKHFKFKFKFIGGPWDGEYHEIDTSHPHDYLDVSQPKSFDFDEPLEEPVLDEDGNPMLNEYGEPLMRMIKPEEPDIHTRYTLRHMAGEGGNVYWYSPNNWPDMYTLSQLIHYYKGVS